MSRRGCRHILESVHPSALFGDSREYEKSTGDSRVLRSLRFAVDWVCESHVPMSPMRNGVRRDPRGQRYALSALRGQGDARLAEPNYCGDRDLKFERLACRAARAGAGNARLRPVAP